MRCRTALVTPLQRIIVNIRNTKTHTHEHIHILSNIMYIQHDGRWRIQIYLRMEVLATYTFLHIGDEIRRGKKTKRKFIDKIVESLY